MTKRECELCRDGLAIELEDIKETIKSNRISRIEQIDNLRKEMTQGRNLTITLIGIFISVLGLLMKTGVI